MEKTRLEAIAANAIQTALDGEWFYNADELLGNFGMTEEEYKELMGCDIGDEY